MYKDDCRPLKIEIHACLSERHRNALFSLYLSVGFFTLACLVGGLLHTWSPISARVDVLVTIPGVLCALYAALQLAREAFISSETIKAHVNELSEQ